MEDFIIKKEIKEESNLSLVEFMIYSSYKILSNYFDNNLLDKRVLVEDELDYRGGYNFVKQGLDKKELKSVYDNYRNKLKK